MKRFALLSICAFFLSLGVKAQKVDIDNFNVEVKYANLPDNYTHPSERSYSLFVDGAINGSRGNLRNQIRIFGWTPENDDVSDLNATIVLKNMTAGRALPSNRTEEKKDKDGKVISRTTYYKYGVTNTGNARLVIYGPKNSYDYYKDARKDAQKQREKEEKEKEKARKKGERVKAEEENPFLKSVNTQVQEVEEVTRVNKTGRTLAYDIDLGESFIYNTGEYATPTAAEKEFYLNAESKFSEHGSTFLRNIESRVNNHLNELYGFKPMRKNARFKKLDSKDHPEYKNYNNAMQAVKVIFGKMRYNQAIDDITQDLQPVIAYFDGIATKLARSQDKNDKKLRAATYYNLAQIYYYLDQHDKVIEIGEQIIDSKHDEGDGKDFIKNANKIMDQLYFLNMKNRHIVPTNEADKKDEVGEDDLSIP